MSSVQTWSLSLSVPKSDRVPVAAAFGTKPAGADNEIWKMFDGVSVANDLGQCYVSGETAPVMTFQIPRSTIDKIRIVNRKDKGQVRSGHVQSGQVTSGHVRSGHAMSRQVRSGQVRSGQVRSGQVRSGQVRSGQARPGQARSG